MEMEDIFEISECSNAQKVKYATRMLKGEALHWWDIIKVARGKEYVRVMTWEQFTKLVRDGADHFNTITYEFFDLGYV